MSPELSASSILDGVNDQSVNENHRAWRLTTDVYIIKIQNRRVKNTQNRPGIRKNLDNSQKKTMYGVSYSTAVGYHELPFWHEYISQNFFKIKNVFKKWFHFQWCKLEIQYIYRSTWGNIGGVHPTLVINCCGCFSRQVMRVILCGKRAQGIWLISL